MTTAAQRTENRAISTARIGFWAVVVAAGASGAALLASPASTSGFFSWALGPPPLAALVGGLYLASSIVFAVATRLPAEQIRSLLAANVALTLPTIVATLLHLRVFDFGRWQAAAWMALFVAAPPFWGGLLGALRGSEKVASDDRVSTAALILAGGLAAGSILTWVEPEAVSVLFPFEVAGLGGRFAGAWLMFLAVMAGWYAMLPERRLLPALSLVVYPAGAAVAALRSFSDLEGGRNFYVLALVAIAAAFVRPLVRSWRSAPADPPSGLD